MQRLYRVSWSKVQSHMDSLQEQHEEEGSRAVLKPFSSSSCGFDTNDRQIPISEFYSTQGLTCKNGTPSNLEYQDVITTTMLRI